MNLSSQMYKRRKENVYKINLFNFLEEKYFSKRFKLALNPEYKG